MNAKTNEQIRGRRAFLWIATGVLFLGLALGILQAVSGGLGPMETFLRRSRGQAIGRPLTPSQAAYVLEARRGGQVVPTTIADFEAQVIFVNFWGTFCPPCIEELPSLLALARSRSPSEFLVLAVAYDDSWEVIDQFFARNTSEAVPPNFVVLRDPVQVAGRDLKALFGTEKIPETWLVRKGVVEARFVNARDWLDPAIVGLIEAARTR
ncbi:TlpA family protein disulfide reductase [Myxococcota bacterium]|jgi:thiol-disulfide isomerase/thioredoxin|nr:TlpA family protein disulfide reductase [Myxococcota bacterium]